MPRETETVTLSGLRGTPSEVSSNSSGNKGLLRRGFIQYPLDDNFAVVEAVDVDVSGLNS